MSGGNALTETGFWGATDTEEHMSSQNASLKEKKVWKTTGIQTDSRGCWLYELHAPNFFADYWLGVPCFFVFAVFWITRQTWAGTIRVSRVFRLQSIQFSMVAVLMRRSVWKVMFVIKKHFLRKDCMELFYIRDFITCFESPVYTALFCTVQGNQEEIWWCGS